MTITHVGRTFAVLSGVLAVAVAAAVMAAPAAAQSAEPAGHDEVTFTKDIAPILQRSCQKCHRPDSLAPMSLIDYDEVRPWARAIKYRTGLRDQMGVMPPWFIEKDVGIQDFKDDPSLTEEEILQIAAWADNGAPMGNPEDMPPPVAFIDVDEWEIGQPDLIVRTPSVEVKADAPDWWGALADTPTNLPEDRYVAAVEFKEVTESRVGEGRNTVGGNFVFHHAGLGVVGPDFDPEDELARAGLSSWPVHEVGRNADFFVPEAGKLIEADSKVTFSSIHLHANGADTTARLDVGFKFHPKGYEPSLRQQLIAFGNGVDLDIEGNDPNVEVEAYFTLPKHLKMAVYEPHMHAPRRADVPGGHLGQHDRDAQLLGLRPQLGAGLQLRGPRGAAAAEGHHPAHHRLLQQLGVQPERARSPQLVRLRPPLRGPDVHQHHAGQLPR